MAIDQNGVAERAGSAQHQLPQGAVIGLVEPLYAVERLVGGEVPAIDVLAVGDDARDRAETASDTH
jgi:hypothetical protein